MGKLKRPRQKLHASSKTKPPEIPKANKNVTTQAPILIQPTENLFAGIDINISNLNRKLNDDVISIKSAKSVKSTTNEGKPLSKKDKLKQRREVLLQKIDLVNQLKKELKRRKKRKNNTIIGDTNPLHDALPSLESLKKKNYVKVVAKPKAIQKSSKRKKKSLQNIAVYKKLLKNMQNPLKFMKDRIQEIVNNNP